MAGYCDTLCGQKRCRHKRRIYGDTRVRGVSILLKIFQRGELLECFGCANSATPRAQRFSRLLAIQNWPRPIGKTRLFACEVIVRQLSECQVARPQNPGWDKPNQMQSCGRWIGTGRPWLTVVSEQERTLPGAGSRPQPNPCRTRTVILPKRLLSRFQRMRDLARGRADQAERVLRETLWVGDNDIVAASRRTFELLDVV